MRINSLIAALVLSTASLVTGCASEADQVSDTDQDASSAGSFDIWQATDGQWHFHLKSGNGSILLTSEAYTSRTGAINGVLSTETNGVDKAMFQVTPAANGGFLLHLVAGNNEIIGFSQVYSTKSSATRAVSSCVKAVTSYLDKQETLTTGARVEVAVGESGQYHFNVHAKNGEIVLSSESYTTEAAALNGAFAVQAAGTAAASYQILQNSAGGFYFTLTADNGQIVGTSQQYSSKQAAQGGVTSLMSFLPSLRVL
jgi:uncharacterized protein